MGGWGPGGGYGAGWGGYGDPYGGAYDSYYDPYNGEKLETVRISSSSAIILLKEIDLTDL